MVTLIGWGLVLVMVAIGWVLLRTLVLAIHDRMLWRVVWLSYAVRLLVAAAFFAISYWHWPVLKPLQLGRGFWMFGLDCPGYDFYGAMFTRALKDAIELPNPGTSIDYFLAVAGVYQIVGRQPLAAIFFNGWLASMSVIPAYLIGRRLYDRKAALTGAMLVGFWPSSLIWSAQLLKDSLMWVLILSCLSLCISSVTAGDVPQRFGGVRAALRCAALAVLVILLTRLRFYMGVIFSIAVIAVFGPAVLQALLHRRIQRAAMQGGVILTVVVSTLFSRALDPYQLLNPAHPERSHFALAERFLRRGSLASAAAEYVCALRFDPDFLDAYLQLASVEVQDGSPQEAQAVYTVYYGHERDPAKRARTLRLIVALSGTTAPSVSSPQERVVTADVAREAWAFAGGTQSLRSPATVHPFAKRSPSGLNPAPTGPLPKWPAAAPGRMGALMQSLSKIDDQASSTMDELTPQALGSMREGFVATGGYSLTDAWAKISTPEKLITYLPRALVIGLLAPFPWQWFDTKGSTGIMRMLAGIEMVLLYYLLFTSLIAGVRRLLTRMSAEGLFVLAVIALTAIPMCLVIANLGTLFRLRLQFFLPLLIVIAGGNPIERLQHAGGLVDQLGGAYAAFTRSLLMRRAGSPSGRSS